MKNSRKSVGVSVGGFYGSSLYGGVGFYFSDMLGNIQAYIRNIGLAVVFSLSLVAANAMAMSMRERTTEIAVLTFALPIAYVLLLLFASGLRSVLDPADHANAGIWSRLSFAGAITMVSVSGIGWAFWSVLGVEEVLDSASDGTVTALFGLITIIFSAVVPCGQAAFVGGASIVILRSRVMHRWIGWFGLVISFAMLAGSVWRLSGDPEGLLGPPPQMLVQFVIWTLAVSITLIRAVTPESTT